MTTKINKLGYILLPFLLLIYSCSSSPKAIEDNDTLQVEVIQKETVQKEVIPEKPINEVATVLPVPKLQKTYFQYIDNDVMQNTQIASPSSLKIAYNKIRRGDGEYEEAQKVMIAIMAGIMSSAWPSENITWEIPSNLPDNQYTGVLSSVKKGIYDSSTKKDDFFSLVLPSLVLFSSSKQENYYDEALSSLRKASTINSNSVLVSYMLGVLYKKKGNSENAVTELRKAYMLDSNCYEIMYEYASILLKEGHGKEAYDLAKKMLSTFSQHIDVLKLCAEAAFFQNDITGAEQYVARVLQKEPDNIEYILFRAKVLYKKGEYLKVSSLLDVYAKTNRTNLEYLLLRAKLQVEWNKNNAAAIATIQEALSHYPNNDDVLLLAGELSSITGQRIMSKNAVQLVDSILKKDPLNKKALKVSIDENIRLNNWEEAYKASTRLNSKLTVEENETVFLIKHVEICLKLNKTKEATDRCYSLYRSFPNDERVQEIYLKVLIDTNKEKDASVLIEKLLTSASTRMKSVLFYERSRIASTDDQKLSDLRSSLTTNPRNSESLFDLYVFYFNRKDYRKAQYYLKQAIALDSINEELLTLNNELESLLRY